MNRVHVPTIEEVLADPDASHWMKDALRSALARDPVGVANDAAFLCALLDKRADAAMEAGRAAVAATAPQVERSAGDKPGCAGLEGQGFALLAGPASLRAARAVLPASFLVSLLLAGWIFSFPVFRSLTGFP